MAEIDFSSLKYSYKQLKEELKKAKNELILEKNKSNDNLLLLNETGSIAKVGGWKLDLTTNKLTWTREVYAIHEVDEDFQPTVEKGWGFYHLESRAILEKAYNESLANASAYDLELKITTAKGNIKDVRAIGKVINNKDAIAETVFGTFQDITEKKQNEDEIKRTHYYLHKALEIGKIGTWELDIINNKLIWTKENYKNFGLKHGTPLTYETFSNCIHPEDREYVQDEWSAAIKGKPYDIEHRIISDGKVKWLREKAEVKFDENGKAVSAIGFTEDITKFKEFEQNLKESQEQYRNLFENIIDEVHYWKIIKDKNGEIKTWELVDANKAALKGWNKTKEQVIGKTTNEIFNYDGEKLFMPIVKKIFNTGKPYRWEKYFPATKQYLAMDSIPLGEYFFSTGRDISIRKKEELELQNAKEQANSSLEQIKIIHANTPSITWKWDIDKEENFKNCYISEGADELLALPKGIIGNSITKFFSYILPEYIPLVDNAIKNANENINKLISVEYEVKKADGKLVWFLSTGKVIFYNEKLTIYGFTIDITEKKQNEQKLMQSDRVFNLSLDMFCIAGFDGYFKYLNPAWEKTLGYSVEELLSKPWLDFVHPDDAENTENVKSVIADGKEIYQFENRYISKDGSTKWMSWNAQPFPKENMMIGAVRDITEKKRIEKELTQAKDKAQESEKQLKNSQKVARIGYYILNVQAGLWTSSDMLDEIFGIHKNYVRDVQGWLNIIHPDFQQEMLNYFSVNILKNQEIFNKTYKIRNVKSGHDYWVEGLGTFEYDENGNLLKMFGTIQDISKNKSFEQELIKAKEKAEESKEILKTTLKTAMDGYWVVDMKGRFLNVNDTYCNMSGYSRKELLSMFISDVEATQSQEEINKNIQKIKQLGQLRFETKHKSKDGTIYDVEIAIQYQEINDGQFVCFIKDIAEQKKHQATIVLAKEVAEQNELKIKLNEKRLKALIELNHMTDKSDDFIYDFTLNKAIELTQSKIGFLGFVNNDESEVDIYKWSISAMKDCTVKNFNMNFNVDEAGIWGDVIRQRKSLIFNNYSQPIPNKKGIPIGHINIKNYLSIPTFQHNKIVAIISVSNKEDDYIQSDINQVTLLLDGMSRFLEQRKEKEELIEAKVKAEESDRLKSAFLANMSHEIRTPMNGILGFTELLQNSSLSVENQHNYIEIIRKSSNRLLNTVNDIIEISKIESGGTKVIKSQVDLIMYLDNHVKFFKPEAEKKEIKLIVQNEIVGNELTISTDKNKMSSILSNLIKNAIKFTDSGTIKVGFRKVNERVLFFCEDTGPGIFKDRQEAIFNRFEQADIEDKQAHQGTGLGLAIVKSYAEMLDGKIWLESEEGLGSIFYVSLPDDSVKKEELKSVVENFGFKREGFKVLIVEDDEFSLIHLETVMKEITQNISIAQNGVEAVEILKNDTEIDIVLMDIKMPKMNGFEATRKIREFNKDIVIIAQTAFALEGDRQKALDAGVTDYITKPIKKDKIIELINCYL